MNVDATNVLIVYHSYNGPVQRLAEGIAAGARQVAGVSVEVKSVETVTDDDLLAADGIAIGSPKNPGHCISPPIYALIEQLNRLRRHLHDKVGTAFSGSHGSFGGQEIVNQTLFRAILSSNMLVVGLPQPDEHWNDFAGGVIVEELDERTGPWAHGLGARLAEVARRIRSDPASAS